MVSKASDSAAKLRPLGEQSNVSVGTLTHKINQLKRQIQAERSVLVKEKLEKNAQNLGCHVDQIIAAIAAASKNNDMLTKESESVKMLLSRMARPLCKFTGFAQCAEDEDYINSQEVVCSISIKLPYVEKLPPYTTWRFLDRNQRMAEDQSVVGRRRIYYDQHGSEALICSDSEEEVAEPDEEKHDFSEGEDRILWMAFQEHGIEEEMLNTVNLFIEASTLEIQERYNTLKEKKFVKHDPATKGSEKFDTDKGISLDKTLSSVLDSFDNLFCRRCMLFDCRLHGCSQSLIYPSERQLYWSEHEDNRKPCSERCYLKLRVVNDSSQFSSMLGKKNKTSEEGEEAQPLSDTDAPNTLINSDIITDLVCISTNVMPVTSDDVNSSEIIAGALSSDDTVVAIEHNETMGKRKFIKHTDSVSHAPTLSSEDLHDYKKQKNSSGLDVINATSEADSTLDFNSSDESNLKDTCGPQGNEFQRVVENSLNQSTEQDSMKSASSDIVSRDKYQEAIRIEPPDITEKSKSKQSSDAIVARLEGASSNSEWKPIERELYMKGLEIFGRNSCLVARNLLSGLKTCIEVFRYMHDGRASMYHRSTASYPHREDGGKTDTNYMDQDMPTRSRLLRRRGKARKLKYSWKSAGHPSFWKRIADGKNQSCKQFTPCGCQSMCGKQCPCLHNGTCCEKYCGCSKSCKNRFRGCHCAKSQCRSRQCPCFAAGRECDPDVCRNCWVSCGDGSLGEPPKQGDSQCGNMRLLLRQQQRILLAKSDVAGWGAFLKNSVNKNDYLGEYTGELISHREADKRGKIYDRANSSFLFDLNDQYVLDAYRKGDKLKFANHSSNPNCYAKVMLVAGDHRVGIFAKERIESSEELFYDYRYGPDQAPAWARKPEDSKIDDAPVSQGRAKKHQSH